MSVVCLLSLFCTLSTFTEAKIESFFLHGRRSNWINFQAKISQKIFHHETVILGDNFFVRKWLKSCSSWKSFVWKRNWMLHKKKRPEACVLWCRVVISHWLATHFQADEKITVTYGSASTTSFIYDSFVLHVVWINFDICFALACEINYLLTTQFKVFHFSFILSITEFSSRLFDTKGNFFLSVLNSLKELHNTLFSSCFFSHLKLLTFLHSDIDKYIQFDCCTMHNW